MMTLGEVTQFDREKIMSKKNQRVQKLIALENMIRHQTRNKDGSAKFVQEQLDAAIEVIEEILKLDNIVKMPVN